MALVRVLTEDEVRDGYILPCIYSERPYVF